MKLNKIILAIFCVSMAISNAVFAGSPSEASANVSADISVATGSVVVGSAILLSTSGELLIEGVEKVADGVIYVVKNISTDASKATTASIKLVGNVAGAGSLVVGQSITVIAESTGAAIMASGKLIAFIPNEIGKSLIYHQQLN